ncbi:hypothetical protein [Aquisediminimonas sediminicola]|uniref:hypothetical protein n=1 Tax=Alteraquisediminimonas sediminicola TaxID=2676787 RepID=UPI001C8D928F|nr:hypothetical protein [Aquisediminimonas sediminicola]
MIANGASIERYLTRATLLIGATHWLLLLSAVMIGQGRSGPVALYNPVAWGILCVSIVLIMVFIRTIRHGLRPLIATAQTDASLHLLLARMERDAQRQQQLSDDMVHDLRTCLSVLQLQADLHDHIATEKLQPHYRDMAQLISGHLARTHDEQRVGSEDNISVLSRDAKYPEIQMTDSSNK